jgi:hypothetical protein
VSVYLSEVEEMLQAWLILAGQLSQLESSTRSYRNGGDPTRIGRLGLPRRRPAMHIYAALAEKERIMIGMRTRCWCSTLGLFRPKYAACRCLLRTSPRS